MLREPRLAAGILFVRSCGLSITGPGEPEWLWLIAYVHRRYLKLILSHGD